MNRFTGFFFLALLAALTCGCGAFERGPEDYPYVAEQVRESNSRSYHQDLDGDGRDEILKVRPIVEPQGGPRSLEAVKIETQGGQVVNQVNFAGDVVRELQFCDLGGDGTTETIVPVLRSDSLFLVVVGAGGRKRRTLYLTEGEPRREPEGLLPWDPELRDARLIDVTGDSERELVAVMMTRLARHPRGVWILDPKTGERRGRWTSGAMLDDFVFDDLTGGKPPELLVATGAPNNGAEGNGMDDQHAYVFLLRLAPRPGVVWKREMGGLWATARLEAGEVDGDGKRDYIILRRSARQRPEPARLERIDPKTGRPLSARTVSATSRSVAVANLDGTGTDEILVSHRTGKIQSLGPDLQVLQASEPGQSAAKLTVVSGLIQPGTPEVIVTGASSYLLGADLEPKALLPTSAGGPSSTIMKRGPDRPPYLVLHRRDKTIYLRIAGNPAYLLYRWGPWALLVIGIGFAGGLVVWGRRVYRRHQALRRERVDLAETKERACLLAGADGTVEHVGERARSILGLSDPSPDRSLLARKVPDLSRLLEEISGGPPEEKARAIEVPAPGDVSETRRVQARAEPLGGKEEPGTWLVELRAPGTADETPSYRTWRLLAQRVAHDLRNPLTSIRLTLQSMQMAYRKAPPELAEELEGYTDQIDDRIESLRRSATNVMKLVGAEETDPLETDLSAFVRQEAKDLRADLPADVELQFELEEDLPAVSVDREQMASVLENLVTNAIEALPEGGVITVQTRLARSLQLSSDPAPRDYVVVEVMDTGEGMEPATRARAFEPGFTRRGEGTGLGLALIKKIVAGHGGHVKLESEPGVGTTVCVYLPADGKEES